MVCGARQFRICGWRRRCSTLSAAGGQGVVAWRVHIEEQPAIRVVRCQLFRADLTDGESLECAANAQASRFDARLQMRRDAPCVDRAQWMSAVSVPWQSDIDPGGLIDQPGEKCVRQEWHVAGYHQHEFRRRVRKRRIETPEGAGSGDVVGFHWHTRVHEPRRVVCDNQDAAREPPQHGQLPVEYRTAIYRQGALVASAETAGPAAGQDRRGNGNGVGSRLPS